MYPEEAGGSFEPGAVTGVGGSTGYELATLTGVRTGGGIG